MYQDSLESPLGTVTISSRDGVTICHISFSAAQALPSSAITQRAEQQLAEYFAGTHSHFDLPLDAQGTAFQQSVWCQLQPVPFGTTASYADVAKAIGNP